MHIEHIDALPKSLWERLRAQPERAPELIALAAAERFAPQAEHWVQVSGPGRDPAELARSAYRKHVRLARVEGATLGLGGALTGAVDLAALAWIQSRMVFYVAAAYGFDPRHPMRPAELLALQGLYETPAEARAALDGIGRPIAHAMVGSALSKNRDQAVASRLFKFAGKRVARRLAGRALPLVSSPIAAVQNGGATREVGERALAYYGGEGA